MRCLECNHSIAFPGLLVAMEQREHFAMVRHTEICQICAPRMLDLLETAGAGSRHFRQSIDCAYCGSKLPITRLRFEIKDRPHRYIALCEKCYRSMRDDLMRRFPNFVSFIEKEWETLGAKSQKRVPWGSGTTVKIKAAGRFHDLQGTVERFRPLVVPWFGYDVRFPDGQRHFFHERDLEVLELKAAAGGDGGG
jgi:hypothetical protein